MHVITKGSLDVPNRSRRRGRGISRRLIAKSAMVNESHRNRGRTILHARFFIHEIHSLGRAKGRLKKGLPFLLRAKEVLMDRCVRTSGLEGVRIDRESRSGVPRRNWAPWYIWEHNCGRRPRRDNLDTCRIRLLIGGLGVANIFSSL